MADLSSDILLERRLHAYRSFLAATKQLADALVSGNMNEIDRHLRKREACMRAIDHLDRKVRRRGKYTTIHISGKIRDVLKEMEIANRLCMALAERQQVSIKKTVKSLQGYAYQGAMGPKLLNIQT